MDLWETRRKSLLWLDNDLASESQYLMRGYAMIDECIALFDEISEKEKASLNGRFARICGLTATKGRNLLLGCHSLQLDALGQEAGALLRPLIEVVELLNYFRLDPNRIDIAIEGKLPSAGLIAKTISGRFQALRDHLNEQASHFRFGFHSVSHLLDKQTLKLTAVQTHSPQVLKYNFGALSAFLSFLLLESVSCLFAIGIDVNNLADRAEAWKGELKTMFSPIAINKK
jgi:hypothetical protein